MKHGKICHVPSYCSIEELGSKYLVVRDQQWKGHVHRAMWWSEWGVAGNCESVGICDPGLTEISVHNAACHQSKQAIMQSVMQTFPKNIYSRAPMIVAAGAVTPSGPIYKLQPMVSTCVGSIPTLPVSTHTHTGQYPYPWARVWFSHEYGSGSTWCDPWVTHDVHYIWVNCRDAELAGLTCLHKSCSPIPHSMFSGYWESATVFGLALWGLGTKSHSHHYIKPMPIFSPHQQSIISLEILESPFFKKRWFLEHLELI